MASSQPPSYMDTNQSDTPDVFSPQRPPSPAPSYHTLPPNTHTTVSSTTIPAESAALRRAAIETPNAILSHLNITNNPTSLSIAEPITARVISAKSEPDGKERFHVTFPSVSDIHVYRGEKVKDKSSNENDLIGKVRISSESIRITYPSGERTEHLFEELQRTQRLLLPLAMGGATREFNWEIVTQSNATADERRQSHRIGNSNDEAFDEPRRRKEQQLIGLRLADVQQGNVFAGYVHNNDIIKSATERRGKWGYLEVKTRSVLLDEGVEKAFVAMIALLEAYVRLFGKQHPGAKGVGLLAAVFFCTVM